MKTRLQLSICLLSVLLPASLLATSYTAIGTGHFNTTSTWTPTGHPTSGDTFTIPSGFAVTCDSTDGACESGTAAASTCTADGAVQQGGTLTLGSGGTLTHAGELDINHGATLNGSGTLIIRPGSGATCKLNFNNVGTGAAAWSMSGTSTASPAIVKGDLSGGGTAFILASPSGGTYPTLSLSNFRLDTCGTSTIYCVSSSNFLVSGNTSITDMLLINSGCFLVTFPSDGTSNIVVNGLSIVNAPGSACGARFVDSAVPTSAVRTFKNMTCYEDTAVGEPLTNLKYIALLVNGAKCGTSTLAGDSTDSSCFQGYNCSITHNDSSGDSSSILDKETFFIDDTQSFGANLTGLAQAGQMWEDGIAYTRMENPHQWTAVTNVAGSQNFYTRNICDGDGVGYGDTGNMVEDNGLHTMNFNIDMNGCGELDSDQGSATGYNDLNNTTYHGYGVSLGNSGAQYPNLVVKRNLFTYPYDPRNPPQENAFQTGLVVQASFVRQTSFTLDYNGYFGMMGSGDGDPIMGSATTCGQGSPSPYSCPLPNATAGTTVSYVGIPVVTVGGGSCTLGSGTNSTTAVFSACSTAGLQAGDFVVLQSGTRPFAQISSVTNGTTLALVSPGISGLSSGQVVAVAPSYWATAGTTYGTSSGVGTHDIHSDPRFVDPTRSVCSYYVRVGGGTANCNWTGALGGYGQNFVSTGVSGTTTIDDTASGVNFVTLGITANNDWINIYQGNTDTWRCTAEVTAVSASQLTISSCSGLTSGDAFGFITATRKMGQAIVTLNGWDYEGNPTTPVSWATTHQVESWIRTGFRPQNFVYKGAGDDGSDLGAVPMVTSHIGGSSGWR